MLLLIYPAPAPLTSVKQNTKLAGEIMVDSVLKLVRGGAVKAQRIPTSLIVRESTTAFGH
ncbi:protein of unknown function, might belong to LacI family transcriptional regulator [Shewanella benthica]|uniref:Transcriptional regulator LacI/GalR-like sensor domain-containing protein n=1 Tax=Shewanella benthica TaxID=43661 RepID=A0A330M795_9GAMM|nr:protein of unknown function, might belong to LacI family transcriptional regulator [Shewanella benthica]